jgi:CRISPR/Cas system-associated exonuclease Cas4 (RecB family)
MSFLSTVTADLYARYGEGISRLCLVFPNKRAHLFFSQHLSHIIEKPLWQPDYRSIEELIAEASPLRVADTFTLLVELYAVYCAERKTGEPFDHFYPWGETLLLDFDQIDKYRVSTAALFTNLRDRKALEGDYSFLSPEQMEYIRKFWSHFSADNESKLVAGFIALWEVLPAIYQQFRKNLTERAIAYEGMIYRDVADAIAAGTATDLFPKHYVFIGFNALNECEKMLFRFLQEQRKADFYWDYDAYYLNDPQQEAGLFLRENVKNFPSPLFDPDFSPFSEEKHMTVIAAPSNIAQAKVVPQLWEDMPSVAAERTVIVLADKQLLIPVLHTLPAVSNEINISMGYPLQQTGIYSLVDLLLLLFAHEKHSGEQHTYYYRDLLAFIAHPYIKQLISNDKDDIYNKLITFNNIRVSNSFFVDNQILYDLLAPVANYRDLSDRLLFLMDQLSSHPALNRQEPLLHGYIQHVVCQINKLTGALQKSTFDISINLYYKILHTVLQKDTIPFTGEPLAGIQVLGLFETVGIDFDNVVVLSANEGILPAINHPVSFIPYNLRRGFGLPLPEQQEAVSAYYFYRLLQRAQTINLVYSTKTDDLHTGAGEPSRYLLQLQLESGHKIEEKTLRFDIDIPEHQPVVVKKEAINKLDSLSPSALNSYLTCPLQFYFRYIARLKEPDEVTEKVDARLFGSLLHRSMEFIYQPWIGTEITEQKLDSWLNDTDFIPNRVRQSIAGEYYKAESLPVEFYENGDLLLVYDIICQYIRQLLRVDKKQAPFVPEGLEVMVEQMFPFVASGQAGQIRICGIIDRLHRKGERWYVVDYKTGKADNTFESIAALFGTDRTNRHNGILQTLLYSIIVQNDKKQTTTPLLYSLRESHSDEVDYRIFDKSAQAFVTDAGAYADVLTNLLSEKLGELLDTSRPFEQTPDRCNCDYCSYKPICNIF